MKMTIELEIFAHHVGEGLSATSGYVRLTPRIAAVIAAPCLATKSIAVIGPYQCLAL